MSKWLRVLERLRIALSSFAGKHAWAFMLWHVRRLHEERSALKQRIRELEHSSSGE